jgi:hypothetical protein
LKLYYIVAKGVGGEKLNNIGSCEYKTGLGRAKYIGFLILCIFWEYEGSGKHAS